MAKKRRKLDNWLKGLAEFVEDTEASREFWLWSGITTICAAMQRKVWVPYGLENIYPNIYTMLIAHPGERKAHPVTLAKRMLEELFIPVAVDSSSKRAFTQELAQTAETEMFIHPDGKQRRMATLAVISKELSSLLAVNPKEMVEVLTDVYDSHDTWKYKTSGQGQDYLYNVCVNCLVASTPRWIADNLPPGAIGGGYTSRQIIVTQQMPWKDVPWPLMPDQILYRKLLHDLNRIHALVGEFKVDDVARAVFEVWYKKLRARTKESTDEKKTVFMNRMHVHALKVSMALRVAYSDELVLGEEELGQAIEMVEKILKHLDEAFAGYGISKLGPQTEVVKAQIRQLRRTSLSELLAMNYQNLGRNDMEEVLTTLEAMKLIKRSVSASEKDMIIEWVKPSASPKQTQPKDESKEGDSSKSSRRRGTRGRGS